jgi:hypothetical protein
VTASPTDAPTSTPTQAGFEIVEVVVETKVLKVELTFAVTAEEAVNPVMQLSLEAGFANALGLAPSSVKVSSISGVAVRRRLAETAIEFKITSNSEDTAQTAALQANVETAVTTGSVVANVQKVASDNGVLTADLNSMPRELPAPTVAVATVVVTTYAQQRVASTSAPTSITTSAPTLLDVSSSSAGDSLWSANRVGPVYALVVGLVLLLTAYPAM